MLPLNELKNTVAIILSYFVEGQIISHCITEMIFLISCKELTLNGLGFTLNIAEFYMHARCMLFFQCYDSGLIQYRLT